MGQSNCIRRYNRGQIGHGFMEHIVASYHETCNFTAVSWGNLRKKTINSGAGKVGILKQ